MATIQLFPNSADGYLKVHSQGSTKADVTGQGAGDHGQGDRGAELPEANGVLTP